MIADCDMRTRRLIEKHVRLTLAEMYGSVFELVLFKITNEEEQVIVQSEFFARPGQPGMAFAIVMPRVDGPLDYFL